MSPFLLPSKIAPHFQEAGALSRHEMASGAGPSHLLFCLCHHVLTLMAPLGADSSLAPFGLSGPFSFPWWLVRRDHSVLSTSRPTDTRPSLKGECKRLISSITTWGRRGQPPSSGPRVNVSVAVAPWRGGGGEPRDLARLPRPCSAAMFLLPLAYGSPSTLQTWPQRDRTHGPHSGPLITSSFFHFKGF